MTTLFGIESIPTAAVMEAPAARPVDGASASIKKNGWLPVLTILFLVSYGLMTMLIVEQGRTIESQRALIHELYRDSSELAATKRALQDGSSALTAPTQPSVTQAPTMQTPSSQTQTLSSQGLSKQSPSTQANTKAPSSQAGPQTQHAQNQSAKTSPEFKMPSKPEPDLVDDVRTLNII